LIVRPDNTFEIKVDHKVINEGSLLSEFSPPVNPPMEIDDPADTKPSDWDEREKIPDPAAVKPADWDEDAPPQIPDPTAVKPEGWLDVEPDMIPDSTAEKPEDWDTEIDGEWEAPLVDNPVCEQAPGCGPWSPPLIPNTEYKGKWRPPMIDNPNYQGKWAARKIPNPDFFEDLTPFRMTPISAVGIELWSMSSDILFDNLIVTDDINVAMEFASRSFDLKKKHIAKESDTFLSKIYSFMNENPIAWRIGLVLLIVPLAYSFYTFVRKGGKKENEKDPKKTDEVQLDDDDEEPPLLIKANVNKDNEQNNENEEPEESNQGKPKKSDLDVKIEDNFSDSSDKDDENRNVPNNQETEASPQKSAGARKRQVRKD